MFRQLIAALHLGLIAAPALSQSYEEVTRARDQLLGGEEAAAIAYLAPLAEAGHPRAQNLMAAAAEHAMGRPQDTEEALRLYTLAAEQGYPPAVYNLGVIHQNGAPGLPPDAETAMYWYERGVEQDYAASIAALASILMDPDFGPVDEGRALALFRRGAELGDARAHQGLGWMLEQGIKTEVDLEGARRHYEIAALMGLPGAQLQAAAMLADGEGGPVELNRALRYLEMAMASGLAYGVEELGLFLLRHGAEFEDPVEGLARCLQGAQLREAEGQESRRERCESWAEQLGSAVASQGEKRAAQYLSGQE